MARILVIDDETNIRTMMRLALQHAGHEVMTASDGFDGIQVYGNGKNFDIIILDQRMPGMDGLEVLRKLRSVNSDAIVIMATAFGTIDLAVEAMKLGATDFLRKPFSTNTLRGAVTTALISKVPTNTSVGNYRVTFALTTINGFRISSMPDPVRKDNRDLVFKYILRSPSGEERDCFVTLPDVIRELVMAFADSEDLPGGDRFWHALSEESLANVVWQQSDFPAGNAIVIDDLTTGMKRWIELVLESNVRN